jgi:tetratricopeptide (TPR) repeat protein
MERRDSFMIRCLLRASVGAALLSALAFSAVVAKPPDLPENGYFTAAPRTQQPACADNVLRDVPEDMGGWGNTEGWFHWLLSHWTARQQPPAPEQNEGYIQRFEPQHVISGLTPAGTLTSARNIPINQTVVETLPMPREEPSATDGVTCPYLRQQMLDRHAVQLADPDLGHDVLDNLGRLKEAEELLDLAAELANKYYLDEAMKCCERAAQLCPGSPCAERAAEIKGELALGIIRPMNGEEEVAETPEDEASSDWHLFWRQIFESMGLPLKDNPGVTDLKQMEYEWERIGFTEMPSKLTPERLHGGVMPGDPESKEEEPGREEMVCGLMKACHLLMSQGMHHQAAELARQAFALDPQRVQADPLIYKMHLLAASPPSPTSEESEPPTCPYCGNSGKPIRAIVAETQKSESKSTPLLVPPLPKVGYEIVPALERVLTEDAKPTSGAEEASEDTTPSLAGLGLPLLDVETNAEGELRLSAECSLGDSVYHLRYRCGCLTIWKTTDAGQSPTK